MVFYLVTAVIKEQCQEYDQHRSNNCSEQSSFHLLLHVAVWESLRAGRGRSLSEPHERRLQWASGFVISLTSERSFCGRARDSQPRGRAATRVRQLHGATSQIPCASPESGANATRLLRCRIMSCSCRSRRLASANTYFIVSRSVQASTRSFDHSLSLCSRAITYHA